MIRIDSCCPQIGWLFEMERLIAFFVNLISLNL